MNKKKAQNYQKKMQEDNFARSQGNCATIRIDTERKHPHDAKGYRN